MNKFERLVLRCIRFLFGRWLSEGLKKELDEMINPTHETFCCEMPPRDEKLVKSKQEVKKE